MSAVNYDGLAAPAASTSAPLVVSEPPKRSFLSTLSDVTGLTALGRVRNGLPNPGTHENLTREVSTTHLGLYFVEGARAELAKSMSLNPLFQITHAFTLSPPNPMMGSGNRYNFSAMYATNKGSIDQDGTVSGRANWGWDSIGSKNTSKVQLQLPMALAGGMSTFQLEHDRLGSDYSVNVKAINPSVDGQGIYTFSYLQSLTKRFALGTEVVRQSVQQMPPEVAVAWAAKYTGADWIATAQLAPTGTVTATYFQRLGERTDAAVDVTFLPAPQPSQRKAIATAGIKYDLRAAQFRAQVDSTGKVGMLLEQRIAPALSFTVGGEIDHVKNASRWGLGIQLESASPELEAAQATTTPVSPPV